MREGFHISAIDFKDLLQLKSTVIMVFETLRTMPKKAGRIKISIFCQDVGSTIIIGSSCWNEQKCDFTTPKGVSTENWAMLVAAELKVHLLACGWLRLQDNSRELTHGHPFRFDLEQV